MLRIFLTILISLQFCIINSQSLDTDGDGIKDENDACPHVAGINDNHGCPGINKEIIEENRKKHEKQFHAFKNNFDFDQLSNLIVKKIESNYFKSDNLISNDIIIVSINITNFGNDISTSKPQLPKDEEILSSYLENSLWNRKNFQYFLKKNLDKKVLTAHSYGDGNNIRVRNYDSKNFPVNKFIKGIVIVPKELRNDINEKLYYYSVQSKNSLEMRINNDIIHRYAGLTIYIQQIKNQAVKVLYYYNFRSRKSKNFQFRNKKWKEISDVEYGKL